MKHIPALLCLLATLLAPGLATAQKVYVNFVPTRAGDVTVPAGSLVHVRNTSTGDVTVQVPYQPPVVLRPGESTRLVVNPNPGGSTYIDGPDGQWRLTADN